MGLSRSPEAMRKYKGVTVWDTGWSIVLRATKG